ncbi:MAG TPA: cytochrome P450 [Candidatus Nanopelagicales bacterium]|nr:cytochrome P450 [Candidatus Nanopelagicales bacterium]
MSPRINLLTPEARANPYPLYARMRREIPVCEIEPGGVFAVTRHADVQYAIKHPELFSSQGFRAMLAPEWLGDHPLARSLLVTDPPVHGKLRSLVSKAFGPALLARYEPRMREIVARLADDLLVGEEVDFVARFSLRLPTLIIAELLGFDESKEGHFVRWGHDLAAITPVPPPPDLMASIRETVTEMSRYFGEIIAARRREPRDDLTSALVQAEIEGERLSDDQIISFLALLLPAGFETTTNLLTNGMMLLADRRDLLERLRSRPADIPLFIEEVLRYDAPVHGVVRLTTTDVTLAGTTLPKGSFILLLPGSANRDEAQYQDPDRFDMDRGTQGGLAFGHGIHFCLGANLARLEARVGFEEILRRVAFIERTAAELTYPIALTVRGPSSLPVRVLRS